MPSYLDTWQKKNLFQTEFWLHIVWGIISYNLGAGNYSIIQQIRSLIDEHNNVLINLVGLNWLLTCQPKRSTTTFSASSFNGWSFSNCWGEEISKKLATFLCSPSIKFPSSMKRGCINAIAAVYQKWISEKCH